MEIVKNNTFLKVSGKADCTIEFSVFFTYPPTHLASSVLERIKNANYPIPYTHHQYPTPHTLYPIPILTLLWP